ncbi:Gfo/Idh/MocA family protein [Pararhizobium mangrovi]|uniref:Gfo/Idh/MocA family oxidoreductase n=1 Tax=Pararhizobium mangrovi TaxID=2590452 RepID=A0A506TYE8_9HYPH|nr:Gfo/Idh/MocA family oxidoreductase [Pararhizobium mangrovi]TPW26228.1 Gfo/Idh/MocA family oxidoreductase [Pararhizobium mangrovi]
MTDLRWGILSTARIAQKALIPALLETQNCRIVSIASRDRSRAADVAKTFNIERVDDDYESLIEAPDIDVIYNPLPNHLHAPLTLRALEAGKHVLCEKPLTLSVEQAVAISKKAAETNRIVAEAFMTRHHPQWQRAFELVHSGAIGSLNAIQILFSYRNSDPDDIRNKADIGGGALYDIGCYALNAARWFFESEPESVIAEMHRDPSFGTDRLTSGLAVFPNGRHLTFTTATQSALSQKMTLLGSDGFLTLDVPFNCPRDYAARLSIVGDQDLLHSKARTETFEAVDQYARMVEAFVAAIREGSPLSTTIEDSIGNAAAIDALIRSSETRRLEAPATPSHA